MKCPSYNSKIEVNGMVKLETLEKHILEKQSSLKEKFQCTNKNCIANQKNIYWNVDGETYG
jgi:aspartate carbamoyltransferase regulatory subunit